MIRPRRAGVLSYRRTPSSIGGRSVLRADGRVDTFWPRLLDSREAARTILGAEEHVKDVTFPHRPVIGLTLSGGGARGLAHIGVLKVLEREGISIDGLSGASMGGILAAAYAAGFSAGDLEAEALRMARLRRLIRLLDFRPPNRGLLTGRKLRAYLAQFLPASLTFADLRLPLALEAVDLDTCEEVPLTEGSVLEAALATSAFPGVLPPVERNGRRLVDGGLLDNLPVDLARRLGSEIVIAVNVGSMPGEALGVPYSHDIGHLPEFLQTALDAVAILTRARTQDKLQANKPEILIHPHLPHNIGAFSSFTRAAEIIAAGEQAALQALPELNALLANAQENEVLPGDAGKPMLLERSALQAI